MEQIRRRRLKAEGGRELLERFGQSRLSVRAFCEREGISTACLYRWRSMLGERSGNSPRAQRLPAVKMAQAVHPGFVELGALGGSAPLEVRLDMGGGVLLTLVRG